MAIACEQIFGFLPAATITNPITNLIHSICLFTYTILAIRNYIAGTFKINIVIIFLIFCTGILLGVYLHMLPINDYSFGWRIAALLVYAQFFVIVATYANNKIPTSSLLQTDRVTQAALIVCLLLVIKFQLLPIATFNRELAWQYLAAVLFIQAILFIFKTNGELRTAFILLLAANLMWPILQKVFYAYGCTDEKYSYFVDVYHILLTIFSFKMYMACRHGYWIYPKPKT